VNIKMREHLDEVIWYISRNEQQAFENFADMRIYRSANALRDWLDEQGTAKLKTWRRERETRPEIVAKLFRDYQSKTDDELAAMRF
jgi:hypothetical protein